MATEGATSLNILHKTEKFSLSVYTNIEEDIEIYILDYLEDNMPFYNFGEYETLSEGLKAFYNATERIN